MATGRTVREKDAGVDLLRHPDVLVKEFKFTEAFNLNDDVPNIQHSAAALHVESVSAHRPTQHQGYFTTFAQEIDFIGKIEAMVDKGQVLVHVLYTYRSVSQAIPETSMNLSNPSKEQEAEAAAKRAEINRKILDVLRPEIVKLKELVSYTLSAVTLFHGCVAHFANKEARKEIVPESMHLALLQLMDTLLILDNLKDIKTCLQADFARYKRVVGAHPSIEILEEITQLQAFLSNPDPRKARNYVFLCLRDEVKRITGHENVFLDALELAQDTLQRGAFVTPEEQFRLLRVLPYLLLVADGEADDVKSFNVFKTGKIKLSNLQKIFKRFPVVPLYGDMTIVMEYVLRRSGHYETKMGTSWGRGPIDGEPEASKPLAPYDLVAQWAAQRTAYLQYAPRLAASLHRLQRYPFQKVQDDVSENVSAAVFALVKDGFALLSAWTAAIKLALCWKYTHPVSLQALAVAGVDASLEGVEYARVLKYNLSREERSILVDVLAMIKSLAAQLDKAEAAFAPYIRFHVHHRLQQLAQGDLTPLLHRLDKRNKPILPTLLKLRALIADWSEGSAPGKDYKEYSRKQGAVQSVQHPARVVGAAPSQLFILRTQVGCLCDSDSEVRQKASFFGKSDLERTDVQLLQAFHADSFYFSYLLDYAHTLTAVSDLGDLWYREYFLEMTRCIQFPIEMSLPWILTEHLILGAAHTPLLESVVLVLDVYNDAAHRALYVLNQQYLYDEIEAEANLVVDQLYFLLSDEIYAYYKALAAEGCLDKALKGKLESLKGAPYLTVEARRMEALLAQRHIQLLGRSLNFSFVLAQNVNNKLYRDIDVAIKRFEAADARAVTELKTLLDVIEQTHSRLSQHLQLDEWDAMLSEVNESFSPSSFRGRISLHMLSSLAKDVLPNFSYNFHTHRFVPSPIAIRPMQYGKAPKQSAVTAVFGPTHAKAFENCARLTRSFFGRPHLEAYLSLGVRIADLSMLIDQLLKNMLDKVVDVSEYLDALKEGIPPCQPPSFLFRTVGAYGYFEGKLRAILDYDDLKPEVFQNFREIGNSIALLSDLSDLLELSDHFDFVVAGPFLGMPAVPGAVPEGGKGGTSTTSPLVRIINHVAGELGASSQEEGKVWQRLPAVVQRLTDGAVNVLGSDGDSTGGKSLLRWVLLQLEEFLYQENLTEEWASNPVGAAEAPNFAFAVQSATGFHRLWSALSFLFCIVDAPEAEEGGEALISNEAEFGHGFTIAGCLLLHLLGQRSSFDVLDFSSHVLQLNAHEVKTEQEDARVEASLLRETSSFVAAAQTQQVLQKQLFSLLEATHQPRDSYTQHSCSKKTFRPPVET